MATGLSRSLEGGHDVIYDYCCSTCEGENSNAEALYYCKDCSQLFCEPCKKYHDKFTRKHTVLGRKEMAKWGGIKPVTSSLMCDEHPGKELEMFCEDHDHVCCSICIGVKHRVCKQVMSVSEVAKGIRKKSRFKSFVPKAAKTQSELKHLYDKQENNIKLLKKARREITSIFKDMRKHFNQVVDRLEEKTSIEMDRLLTILKEKVTYDKNMCSNFHDNIQKFLHDIQGLGKQCDELAFQSYKKCCKHVANAEQLLSSMQDVEYKLEFTPDAQISTCLSSLETLGTFHVNPSGIADTLKTNVPLTSSDHVYSVVDKKTYNVKTSEDTRTCWILGICQLPEGQTAIVDNQNTRVKLLSASLYCVLDKQELPPHPQDICHTTGTELAVSVCQYKHNRYIRKEIQFIDAGYGKLSHIRTVRLDHECFGLVYHNAQLYVCSNTALYVYNMSGNKMKKLYEDTAGKYSTITVARFCPSDDGSRIYITNFDKDLLLTLDSSKNQLSTFSDPEFQYPHDVCVADNGSVFVCSGLSDSILQVDREGKRKMTTLATQANGVYCPQCLCYDRKTNTLLVGQEDDNLLVLKLK